LQRAAHLIHEIDQEKIPILEWLIADLTSCQLFRITDVEKGISGGGDQAAPYICIGNLYFESSDGYDSGIAL